MIFSVFIKFSDYLIKHRFVKKNRLFLFLRKMLKQFIKNQYANKENKLQMKKTLNDPYNNILMWHTTWRLDILTILNVRRLKPLGDKIFCISNLIKMSTQVIASPNKQWSPKHNRLNAIWWLTCPWISTQSIFTFISCLL